MPPEWDVENFYLLEIGIEISLNNARDFPQRRSLVTSLPAHSGLAPSLGLLFKFPTGSYILRRKDESL